MPDDDETTDERYLREREARSEAETPPRPIPRYATPASGVRSVAARVPHLPPYHLASDDLTPVGMPALEKISERTKGISTSTSDIIVRVGRLESTTTVHAVELGKAVVQLAGLDSKVDLLVEESSHTRREREDREKRAETRAEAELAYRRDRSLKLIAIVVPTLVAVTGLIAGLAGAFR